MLTDDLRLREGRLADYGVLGRFHYLRNKPVTATRVFVVERCAPTVVGRYVGRPAERQTAGVLVESLPALSCALRDQALGGRHAGWGDRGSAARLLNGELRCISRVVVHPQWRGLGLAVKLVRHALATMTTPFVEALAAMGRVHPFFARAGMTEYRRWPHRRDQRLLDALRFAGFEPWALANVGRMERWLSNRTADGAADRQGAGVVRGELRRWAGARWPLADQLRLARDRLLCEPVYYLKARDAGQAPSCSRRGLGGDSPTPRPS